jgi:hypothetical protein
LHEDCFLRKPLRPGRARGKPKSVKKGKVAW